jgi:hypothetical protein
MGQTLLTKIAKEYAPYDTHEAFGEGFVAYQWENYRNPYGGRKDGRGAVAAQAWDRGLEAAMRYQRAKLAEEARRYDWGTDPNVGVN